MRCLALLAASFLVASPAKKPPSARPKPTFDDQAASQATWTRLGTSGDKNLGELRLRNVTYRDADAHLGGKDYADVLLRETHELIQEPGADGPSSSLTLDLFTHYRDGITKPETSVTLANGWEAKPSVDAVVVDFAHGADENYDHAVLSWKGLRQILRTCTHNVVEVEGRGVHAWIGFDNTGARPPLLGNLILVTADGELSRLPIEADTEWCPSIEVVVDSEGGKVRTSDDGHIELELFTKDAVGAASLTGFSVRLTFDDELQTAVSIPVGHGKFQGEAKPQTLHVASNHPYRIKAAP
ncbi:MAG: hypothetical protein JST54_10015 [Deltaproteobacteria bacterium]|nr:hypothetical protein [Deltaproteobacteria bacterium]